MKTLYRITTSPEIGEISETYNRKLAFKLYRNYLEYGWEPHIEFIKEEASKTVAEETVPEIKPAAQETTKKKTLYRITTSLEVGEVAETNNRKAAHKQYRSYLELGWEPHIEYIIAM